MKILPLDDRDREVLSRLREARVQSRKTQHEVAQALGLFNRSRIAMIERGDMHLKVPHLLRLCDLYQVSPVWVLMGNSQKDGKFPA